MELIYLWVEEYKNIKKQGFNFSPKFTCKYDGEKKELSIDENKEYVSIFPDNINITAIVGENGSGKSNLLEYLILNSLHHVQHKLMTITFDNKNRKFVIETYNFEKSILINDADFVYLVKNYKTKESRGVTHYETFHALDDYELIYYSISPFDRCNVHQSFHRFNYLGILNENGEFKVRDFLIKQMKSFILLSKNKVLKDIISSLELTIPNKILLNPIDHFYLDEKIGEKIADFLGFNDPKEQTEFGRMLRKQHNTIRREMGNFSKSQYHPHAIITDEDERQQSFDEDKMKNFLYIHFFIETVKMGLSNSLSKAVYQDQIASFVDQYEKTNELLPAIKSFFTDGVVDNAEIHPNKHIHKFIDKFCQISTLELNSFAYAPSSIHNQFIIKLDQIENSFLELFKETDTLDTFELSWLNENMHVRLSSGEIAIMDMLCNIMVSLQKAIADKKSKFLLMFDEIELFLHPKWQKEYMKNIIEVIESVLKNKQCYILLTSHSPFILSDIPKDNVNFIGEKIIHEQTFGANIHTLLSHGFFMKDGLMGEFAKEKIQSVIDFLNGDQNNKLNKQEAWSVIQIIGEPFLKYKLEEKFHEKFSTDDDKRTAEIKRLEEELERLKNVKSKD